MFSQNNIYPSSKAAPYVYICTHKVTGEFYIGYRCANVKLNRTSDTDLPLYQTSSKIVKPIFGEFDWKIVAEFAEKNDAFDFEQQLIFENWGNPLLLNKASHFNNIKQFMRPKIISNETRLKMSKAKIGKLLSPEHKIKIGLSSIGRTKVMSEEAKLKISMIHRGKSLSEEHKLKLSKAGKGHVVSQETKDKISVGNKGKTVSSKSKTKMSLWQKGKPKSREYITEEYRQKMSKANKGKKRTAEQCANISTGKRKNLTVHDLLIDEDQLAI